LRGRISALAISAKSRVIRLVKSNEALFHLAQKLRGAFS
jgi:CelD/BcsL family acetyltransferase involved in cellulose biosynthesis